MGLERKGRTQVRKNNQEKEIEKWREGDEEVVSEKLARKEIQNNQGGLVTGLTVFLGPR